MTPPLWCVAQALPGPSLGDFLPLARDPRALPPLCLLLLSTFPAFLCPRPLQAVLIPSRLTLSSKCILSSAFCAP